MFVQRRPADIQPENLLNSRRVKSHIVTIEGLTIHHLGHRHNRRFDNTSFDTYCHNPRIAGARNPQPIHIHPTTLPQQIRFSIRWRASGHSVNRAVHTLCGTHPVRYTPRAVHTPCCAAWNEYCLSDGAELAFPCQ